jgi:hypothetical protein
MKMDKYNYVEKENLLTDEQRLDNITSTEISNKKYELYTEAEKDESWRNGINLGQGHTKSFEEAAENISERLGLNFLEDKIVQLRDKSIGNSMKNKL